MDFLFPLIASAADSVGKTVDKLNFARNRISPQQFMLLGFMGMILSILAYTVLAKQSLPTFSPTSISLITLIAVLSFGSNIFDSLSLKVDDLSLREPLNDFSPILAGLVGYALFPTERKPEFLVVFILGILIVYYGTHRRKLENLQIEGMHFFLLTIILESLLPSFYQVTLEYISPAYITFFRACGILLLTLFFFSPKNTLKDLTSKGIVYSLVSGVIYALAAVVGLYAIHILGVVQTMLLLLIGPSLRYLSSYFILKEQVRFGEVASSLLLTILVLATLFV